MRSGYLRLATDMNAPHTDYDILVWREADGWHWRVVAVRNGRDVGPVAAGGPEPTEARALAAGEGARP